MANNYVEFIRHFNTSYVTMISDLDSPLTCLFNMQEGNTIQAVSGYRQITTEGAPPKVLETVKQDLSIVY